MNPELDHSLCARYPQIFSDRDAPKRLCAMGRGFEVGDGWYPLIDLLCRALQQETGCRGAPQVVACQVKEKLGSLRFRVRHASERQRAMIALAEAVSTRVCDVCGVAAWPGHATDATGAPRCRQHAGPRRIG